MSLYNIESFSEKKENESGISSIINQWNILRTP